MRGGRKRNEKTNKKEGIRLVKTNTSCDCNDRWMGNLKIPF